MIDAHSHVGVSLKAYALMEYPYAQTVEGLACQSCAIDLHRKGQAILDFAEERDLPFLFHATTWPDCKYSQASDILRIAEARPRVRFCLAHGLLFHRRMLERADAMPNVWVDTAAMKIQVELVRSDAGRTLPVSELIDTDLTDHRTVMRDICSMFPQTIIWGTDSPYYAFMCRRRQGRRGEFKDFALKGTYEDEIAALDTLPQALRERVCNVSTFDFLFRHGARKSAPRVRPANEKGDARR